MIKVKDLNFKVKDKEILKDISFEINTSERVAIVGGNGAGKTTLIESMLGINKKISGEVIFDFEYDKSPLEKIGVQFQDSNFPDGLLVDDIIEFFSDKTINIDKEFKEKLIKDFNIDDFRYVESSKLSGGQSQRLNVFLALMSKPKYLFMDELTTGLDVTARNTIVGIVNDYINKNKATLILITHNPSEIDKFIDRVIVLKKGKLVNDIKKDELIKKYKTSSAFLESID